MDPDPDPFVQCGGSGMVFLKCKRKKNFQRISKNFQYALKYMGLGSEIRVPEKTYSGSRIPDPGVKKAPDPGPDPQHCFYH
jgi:hypothetical protein